MLSDRLGWKELSNSIPLLYNKGVCHVDGFDSSAGVPVSYFYGRGKKCKLTEGSHYNWSVSVGYN